MPRPYRGIYVPHFEGAFMTRNIAYIFAIVGTLTASAQAQQSIPKPTKADAVNVVKIVSTDKTKTTTYCRLSDLGEEITKASDAGDNGKVQQLNVQVDDLSKALGPEFVRLNAGLDQVDFESKEGEEISAELDKLDGLCHSK
jgi:hypothetical protein